MPLFYVRSLYVDGLALLFCCCTRAVAGFVNVLCGAFLLWQRGLFTSQELEATQLSACVCVCSGSVSEVCRS